LRHYVEEGEPSGAKPNLVFDAQAYLTANPSFSEFVDRPLFHLLKIGLAVENEVRGAPSPATLEALNYIDEVVIRGSGDHYFLVRAKRALAEGLDTAAGFALYSQAVNRPDHAEVHLKRLESLREVAKRRGGAFRETAAAGAPFVVPPPKVIGEGNHRPLVSYTRSIFVACLTDARVRARSNFIEVDDVALLDYQGDELGRFDDQLDFDPAVFRLTDDGVWIITPAGEADTIELEEAFTLLGIRASAFGHWMIEFLPKYIAASLSGSLPRVPVLIEADMPKSHVDALELMLPEGVEIIELEPFATARVRRLWCAPNQVYMPVLEANNERFRWEYFVMPPMRMAPIINEMVRRADPACFGATGVERVFLAREPALDRELINHAEIMAAVEARGFLAVFPRRLDFIEQISLLRHARFIIGPEGSALYLALFAPPGTKLCILSNVEDVVSMQTDMTGLFNAIGLDVTVFTGPCARRNEDYPWNSDFEVGADAFCLFLDRWLVPKAAPRSPYPTAS
jgi:capsular polysaccharide biosynthesis protein